MDNSESKELPASQSRAETDMQAQTDGAEEKKFLVKHNKSEIALTLGELLQSAEKGLDYDRIRPSHDFVKKLAAKSGETDIARFLASAGTDSGDTPADESARSGKSAAEEMEAIAKEYPEFLRDGSLKLPEEAAALHAGGMGLLEACRAADLKSLKGLCAKLSAKVDVQSANNATAQASIGSLSGGAAPERDYYTSAEWDRLPQNLKEKYIRSGKIYEFMKKWSGNV